jgi:hypothetical protein
VKLSMASTRKPGRSVLSTNTGTVNKSY